MKVVHLFQDFMSSLVYGEKLSNQIELDNSLNISYGI